MKRAVVVLVALGVVAMLGSTAAVAATAPTRVLVYGDSLVFESVGQIAAHMNPKTWTLAVRAWPGQAPCDWLTSIDSDLATNHPAVVAVATAGDSFTTCMEAPNGSPYAMGSAGFYARYQADLATMFGKVTATGAKMVFIEDPPMLDAQRNSAILGIDAIAATLAAGYPGVSIVKTARTDLSKSGKYVSAMKCLVSETTAMGCTAGQIDVRTVTGDPAQIGLHLCPQALTFPNPCSTYSSGELRFGRAIAAAVEAGAR